jgi:hypothetical protein
MSPTQFLRSRERLVFVSKPLIPVSRRSADGVTTTVYFPTPQRGATLRLYPRGERGYCRSLVQHMRRRAKQTRVGL